MKWGEEPEFFGPCHYFRERMIIRQLTKRVTRESQTLDAGSGNGSLALKIGQKGYKVIGIDSSDNFISYARKMVEDTDLKNSVSFQKGNILGTGQEDSSFDAVVSGEVLEHLEQDNQAVREFNRILRIGGYCIVTVPANPNLFDRTDEWAGHFRRYTKDGLVELFEQNGFRIEQCNYWGFPLVRLFHQTIYLPIFNRKILREGKNISKEQGFLFRILKNKHLHRLGAYFFLFDNLFNHLPLGIGLFLVAKKENGTISIPQY